MEHMVTILTISIDEKIYLEAIKIWYKYEKTVNIFGKSRGKLKHTVTTGKINGKRAKGRQRQAIWHSLSLRHGRKSVHKLIQF